MKAIVLIGHGGVPRDFPREKVRRLTTLESMRIAQGTPMSQEEAQLDGEIRNWPRTEENDPYHFGILDIAHHLKNKFPEHHIAISYNEFCAPSIEAACESLIHQGINHITLFTTMFTRGGIHSETEIPEIVDALKEKHPTITFHYAWPFNLNHVADFLTVHVNEFITKS